MEGIKVDPKLTSLSTTISETFLTITDDWAESATTVGIYALPLIGSLVKVCEWCSRCSGGVEQLRQEARNQANDPFAKGKVLCESARVLTREKQANDLLYIVASVVSLVVFSGMGFAAVGFSAIASTAFWAGLMILHSQSNYTKILKTPERL